MAQPVIPIILLCALPASGKSESRTFLASLTPEDLRTNFCLGDTVQLDDYPYVHMMRQFDVALEKIHQPRVFFVSEQECFKDGHEWGTLILMLNDDYEDLIHRRQVNAENPTRWLMERIDRARAVLHRPPHFAHLTEEHIRQMSEILDAESRRVMVEKNAGIPETLEGKTVVIEFARGGREGQTMPIPAPQGYDYSLSLLSPAILSNAAMLYIWVTPEQSRQKNRERTKVGEDGSILFHGVPEKVLRDDYGCDDVNYLISVSDRPNTIKLSKDGRTYYVPVGIFDNHVRDLTTFIRMERAQWPEANVTAIRAAMQSAFSKLLEQYRAIHH